MSTGAIARWRARRPGATLRRLVRAVALNAGMAVSTVACGAANASAPPMPTDNSPALAEYTGTLLAPARIAALSAAERPAWDSYLLTSRRLMAADRAAVQKEAAARGLTAILRAPNTPADFTPSSSWTQAWVRTAPGQQLVRTVLSYQTPAGGWGKHIDYALGPRVPGTGYNSESDEWAYVGTIDNSATVTELRLLGVAGAVGDSAAVDGFARGVRYLLTAQFPSGCWPQVFPLMGSYHDAATHNDDAMVNVVRFMRDVANGAFAFVPAALRSEATSSVAKAVSCLLVEQVVVQGTRTAWGQQHDPLTHAPVQGRAYEPPAVSGREGSRVMALLMEMPQPSTALVQAIHAAATFYRSTAIANMQYVAGTGLVPSPGASLLWARLMEIGTNRPIFSNRDGIVLYSHDQLTDRRTGYAWYGTEPASALRTFDSWSRTNPLPR